MEGSHHEKTHQDVTARTDSLVPAQAEHSTAPEPSNLTSTKTVSDDAWPEKGGEVAGSRPAGGEEIRQKDHPEMTTASSSSTGEVKQELSLERTPTMQDHMISETSSENEDVHVENLIKTVTDSRPSTHLEKLAQKQTSPWDHLSITLGPPVIVLFDIVVPCIIYYVWFDIHRSRWVNQCSIYDNQHEPCPIPKPEYDKDILGYAIISFGFGEVYILIARVARLFYHRKLCAPLLSRNKWELDATSWVYGVAMLMALIPFVIGSSLEIPELYLYSPACLMLFLVVLMVATLIPFPLPIGINSHARGTPCRPFIYYAAEDFIAVDGLQDREFRIRYNHRYDSSKPFRRMFLELTLWWILGVCTYIGALSAVIWTLEFHYAFGLSLGVLFSYIIIWAATSFFWVRFSMHRENVAYQRRVKSEAATSA